MEQGILAAVARADMIVVTAGRVLRCMAVASAACWAAGWIAGRLYRRGKP